MEDKIEVQFGTAQLEIEIRMRIAELALQLTGMTTGASSPTMEAYMGIYTQLCNEILLPSLTELKNNVVPEMSE